MVVVDTTVWIDYFAGTSNPETEWLYLQMGQQPLALTDLILGEILQGLRDRATFVRVRNKLRSYIVFDGCGVEVALETAYNFRKLRQQGITVRRTIDCLIATFCLRNGHSLLHRDRDFDPFEQVFGLSVVHP